MIENSKQFLMCKILKIKICISTLIQCITSAQVSESVLAAEMSINPTGVCELLKAGVGSMFLASLGK